MVNSRPLGASALAKELASSKLSVSVPHSVKSISITFAPTTLVDGKSGILNRIAPDGTVNPLDVVVGKLSEAGKPEVKQRSKLDLFLALVKFISDKLFGGKGGGS